MWINVNTGGTFALHADIRYECWKSGIELPGILTNEVLEPYGYMPFTQVKPEYDPVTQGISAQPPISNDGVWEQHFEVFELDPATVANNQEIVEVQRIASVKGQLAALDIKSVRAMREGNHAMLRELELEAIELRAMIPTEKVDLFTSTQQALQAAVQWRLDDFAGTRNYDGILSACTYATSGVAKFAAEGQYCVDARDATWSKCYEILGEVIAGERSLPSGFSDIEPELPALVWPI